MITRLLSRKVQHIRKNPLVSIFWAGNDGTSQRSVMVQARVSVLTDPAEIDAFAAAYRRGRALTREEAIARLDPVASDAPAVGA
jgi:nitroimidazol reductase NimA-like FMN-containing flavoprotein (pyridoxamine 5'-phosphate oxidase superfamily)